MTEQKQPANESEIPCTPATKTPKPAGWELVTLLLGDSDKTARTIAAAISQLAKKIPCSTMLLDAIVYEDHEITPSMAKRLEKYVGLTAEEWLAIDKTYHDHLKEFS